MNTFGRIKARNVIEDSSRNPGRPFANGRRVTGALPPDRNGTSAPLGPLADPRCGSPGGSGMNPLSEPAPTVEVRTTALPPCRRCGNQALLTARYPHSWPNQSGKQVTGFKETALCPACDGDDPAATGLLAHLRAPVPSRLAELAALVRQWVSTVRHRTPDLAELEDEAARFRCGEL